jgi:hypothetical protein
MAPGKLRPVELGVHCQVSWNQRAILRYASGGTS